MKKKRKSLFFISLIFLLLVIGIFIYNYSKIQLSPVTSFPGTHDPYSANCSYNVWTGAKVEFRCENPGASEVVCDSTYCEGPSQVCFYKSILDGNWYSNSCATSQWGIPNPEKPREKDYWGTIVIAGSIPKYSPFINNEDRGCNDLNQGKYYCGDLGCLAQENMSKFYPDRDNDGDGDINSLGIIGCPNDNYLIYQDVKYVKAHGDCDDNTNDDPSDCPLNPADCSWGKQDCAICMYPGSPYFRIKDMKAYMPNDYIQSTLQKRKFNPYIDYGNTNTFGIYDNVNIQLKVEQCLTDVSRQRSFIDGIELNIQDKKIIDLPFAQYTKTLNGMDYYVLELKGWDYSVGDIGNPPMRGWLNSKENLQKIFDVIGLDIPNTEMKFIVDKSGISVGATPNYALPFCLHYFGNGNHKITGLIDNYSWNNNYGPIGFIEGIIKPQIESIEPFKTYKNQFSYFADLRYYDDSQWPVISRTEGIFYRDLPRDIITPSCSMDNYVFLNSRPNIYAAWSKYPGNVVISSNSGAGKVFIHEFGHAFGNIRDEYLYNNPINSEQQMDNCNTLQECLLWTKYGGACFRYNEESKTGCYFYSKNFRPTLNSIMNRQDLDPNVKFNTISCGYILQRFYTSTALSSLWNYCYSNLDVSSAFPKSSLITCNSTTVLMNVVDDINRVILGCCKPNQYLGFTDYEQVNLVCKDI